MIWRVRVIPRRNPKFHKNEIDLGDGRSARDDFKMEAIGWVFISCCFIRMKNLGFGMGCACV